MHQDAPVPDYNTEEFIDNYCDIAADEEENAVDRENVDLNDKDEDEDIGQGRAGYSSDEEEDVVNSEGNFNSDVGSDGERVQGSVPVFNPNDVFKPKFELGMIFSCKKELKDAIQSHAVDSRRNIKITKNDSRRVYARCAENGCEWRLNALKVLDESTFQIRQYMDEHKCGTTYHVSNVKSRWLSNKYEESFRTDPNRSVKGFRNDVIKDIRVHVSNFQAYRAKRSALQKIHGNANDQFEKLWDYAEELRRANPNSTIIMAMVDDDGGKKFDKLYICFDAMKQGFLTGCRPVIGVDGCHLKGPHGGILLTALSIRRKIKLIARKRTGPSLPNNTTSKKKATTKKKATSQVGPNSKQQSIPEQLMMPRVNASTTIPVEASPLVVDVPIVPTPLSIDVPHAATQNLY